MQLRRTLWFLTAGALSLILTACPGPAPTKGTLEITVTAPSGMTPSVQVTGPGADTTVRATITATGSTRVEDLEPGEYTVRVNEQVVSGIGYNGSGATLRVEAGKTTPFAVNYAAVSGKIRVTIAGLPSSLSAGINIKRPDNTNLNAAPINAETVLENIPAGTYTIEAPNRTESGSTYASAQNGATLTVTVGEEALVNVSYALNPGTATLTVAGLVAALPTDVTVSLVQGTTTIHRTFTSNGPVNFPNLAPGTYTITANAITNNGSQDYAFALSKTTLNITSSGTDTATLTYSRPTLSVSLSGLPPIGTAPSLIVSAQQGTDAPVTQTLTSRTMPFTGPVSLTLPRFGSYAISAFGAAIGQPVRVAGQIVDSDLTSNPLSASVSSSSPSATASLTFNDGLTGRLFVAGNGAFNNGTPGEDAAYTITDFELTQTTPGLVALTGTGGLGAVGLFRIKFDAQGNLYAMYQFIGPYGPGALSRPRIVRVSAANLAQGIFGEAAPGNKVITSDALGTDPEPADMAFDASGNLWVVNDFEGRLVCIASAALAGTGNVTTASAVYTSDVRVRPQDSYTLTQNIHAIVFDGAGHLWFTAGDYRSDVVSGSAPAQTVSYGRRALLGRINASALVCSGGSSPQNLSATAIPVRMDISNAARVYESTPGTASPVSAPGAGARGILKPVTLVYEASTNSLWVGDFGGSNGLSGPAFRDADADQETLIRVPLNATNTDVTSARPAPDGFNLRAAEIDHRVSIGFTETPGPASTGLQQVFGLTLDKSGALWIAANNNVELGATDTSPGPSDRLGKLYRLTVPARNTSLAEWAVQNVTPTRTISAPAAGVGFVGVAFNR
ncbi:hypothetical protein [uncultured Meiothermus sp.]|jgi:hypothetical protein|uniref:hypothetical protein n=1 Tax=uncultured Meiothermus sp. TaxID=157471 RepID=UPI00262A25AB|nr:hypothetical protein [uncultured Meiothermus sp.]